VATRESFFRAHGELIHESEAEVFFPAKLTLRKRLENCCGFPTNLAPKAGFVASALD